MTVLSDVPPTGSEVPADEVVPDEVPADEVVIAEAPPDEVVIAELADRHATADPDEPTDASVVGAAPSPPRSRRSPTVMLATVAAGVVALVVVGGVLVASSFATESATTRVLEEYAAGERDVEVEAEDGRFVAVFPADPEHTVREGRDAKGAYPVHELRASAGPLASVWATWFDLDPEGLTPITVEQLLRANAQSQADELGGELESIAVGQLGLLVVHEYRIPLDSDDRELVVHGRATVAGTRFRSFSLSGPDDGVTASAWERFATSIELR